MGYSTSMQTHNVLSRVNVHTLRPVFHRLLSPQTRVLHVDTAYVPNDVSSTLQKTRSLIGPETELHIHRMVPFETTDPGIHKPIAVLCIARENASGGYIMTKTNKIELIPGQLTFVPQDQTTWYVSAIGELAPYQDAYVDVVWCAPIRENS